MIKKKFCVLQIGARYNYKIPLFFAKYNLLERFYTDIHSSHIIFKFLNLIPKFLLLKPLVRFMGRKLPKGLPKNLVSDSYLNLIFRDIKSLLSNIFSRVIKDNFANSNSIYTNMITEDIDLLKIAKDKGIHIIYEIILNPNINKIYNDELLKYPYFAINKKINKESLYKNSYIDYDLIKLNLADKIFVPSKYIFNEVIKKGIPSNKISLVEHTLNNNDWLDISPKPRKGRILFVGEVSLLKGIHYFAEACRLLLNKKRDYEFLVVGRKSLNLDHKILRGPKYLGRVCSDTIREIYSKSDIFVLPSLSDAFPSSHLEAMACGLPVIITNTCGNIIEDGVDGFIISPRDSKNLANKIEEIVENRTLRNSMSLQAKKKIKNYKVENYFQNLKKAIDY